MAKIIFKRDTASGVVTIPDEYRQHILKEDDWQLAIDVANASKGESTGIQVINKNRPQNIVYSVLSDCLVTSVIVQYDNTLKIVFDNKTVEGVTMECEDGDVAYTDLLEAIQETGKIISTADEVEAEVPKTLTEALKGFFSSVVSSIEKQQEEVNQMSEEEREDQARKSSILLRKLRLNARKTSLLEMVAEIDLEIKILDKVLEKLENGYTGDEDDDEF